MNRHLKKTISFAALHFSVAFAVTYLLTGDWRVSGAVALIEPCVNTVAFFFHELLWTRKEGQAQGPVPVPSRA